MNFVYGKEYIMMLENNMNETIEEMSLLEVNKKIDQEIIKWDNVESLFDYVLKKKRALIQSDFYSEYKRAYLSLMEKCIVICRRIMDQDDSLSVADCILTTQCVPICASYPDFFSQSSFDAMLGGLGGEIKLLEKRAEKVNRPEFFKFYNFYIIVFVIAMLGDLGAYFFPDVLGSFPGVLGGAVVLLFLVLLFCGRFIGAFLLPLSCILGTGYVDMLASSVDAMKDFGCKVLLIGGTLLAIRFLFKKMEKAGIITGPRKKKIKEFKEDLDIYKESVNHILKTLSFTCEAMIQLYRKEGRSEEEIQKEIDDVEKVYKDQMGEESTKAASQALTRYYTYVLERLEEIEIPD